MSVEVLILGVSSSTDIIERKGATVMLDYSIVLVRNPWPDTVPNLGEILKEVVKDRAEDIEQLRELGEYADNSMGFVIMDPTASASTPSELAVMAVVTIGPDGYQYVPFAASKAFDSRDQGLGISNALAVGIDPHRVADGATVWGHGANVDGLYVGGSGVLSRQDRYQAHLLGAHLSLRVGEARDRWREEHPDADWFCNQNLPGQRYAGALKLEGEYLSNMGEWATTRATLLEGHEG